MKKIFLLLTAIVVFGSADLFAQTESSRITRFPCYYTLYEKKVKSDEIVEINRIPNFFNEWEEWSKLVAKGAPDSQYNDILTKVFQEYTLETDCKYVVLEYNIRVVKYDCEISPDKLSARYPEAYDGFDALSKNVLPESISYFTPKIDIGKPVLYLMPEAEKLLVKYLEEPYGGKKNNERTAEEWSECKKRVEMLREYIPASSSHWWDKWYVSSEPLFGTISVGHDGCYVNIDFADYYGYSIFVTWDGEETLVTEWIQ